MTKLTLNNLSQLSTNENSAVNVVNNNNDTLTGAFDNTLSRDGTGPNAMGADLDMNGHRVLNLPSPSSANDPIRYADLLTVTPSNLLLTENRSFKCSVVYVNNIGGYGDLNLTILGTGPGVIQDGMRFQFVVPAGVANIAYRATVAGLVNSETIIKANDGVMALTWSDICPGQSVTIEYHAATGWTIVSPSMAGPFGTIVREASVVLQASHVCQGKLVLVTDNMGGRILLNTSPATSYHQISMGGGPQTFYIFDSILDPDDGNTHSTSQTVWRDGVKGSALFSNSFYYIYAFYDVGTGLINLSFRTPTAIGGYAGVTNDGLICASDHKNERFMGMIYTKSGDVRWIGDNGSPHLQQLVRGTTSEQLLPLQSSQVTTTVSAANTWTAAGVSAQSVFSAVSKLPIATVNCNYSNTTAGKIGKLAIVASGYQVNGASGPTSLIIDPAGVLGAPTGGSIAKATCAGVNYYSQMTVNLTQAWDDGYLNFQPYVLTDGGVGTFEVDITLNTWQ